MALKNKSAKAKNLDNLLSTISPGFAGTNQDKGSKNITGRTMDGKMKNQSFSIPTRLIVRTGLERSRSSMYKRYFEVNSAVTQNNFSRYSEEFRIANLKMEYHANKDFGQANFPTDISTLGNTEYYNTVDGRREILDAYLYNGNEPATYDNDILSQSGRSPHNVIVVVHQEEPTAFVCSICGKNFTTKRSLGRHEKNVHKDTSRGNQISKINALSNMLKSSHSGRSKTFSSIEEQKASSNVETSSFTNDAGFMQNKEQSSNNYTLIKENDNLKSLDVKDKIFLKKHRAEKNRVFALIKNAKKQSKKSLSHSEKIATNFASKNTQSTPIKGNLPIKKTGYFVANNFVEKMSKSSQKYPYKKSGEGNVPAKPAISQSYKCLHCSMVFSNLNSLNRHVPFHNITKYHCFKCNEIFLNMRSLTKHLILHQDEPPSKDRLFRCKICSKSFQHEDILNDHVLVHDELHVRDDAVISNSVNTDVKTNEDLHCGSCKIYYDSYSSFSNHVKYKHIALGETSLQCDKCSEIFASEAKVYSHLIQYHHVSSREARAILRQKEANSVYLGINASIKENMNVNSDAVNDIHAINDSAEGVEHAINNKLPMADMKVDFATERADDKIGEEVDILSNRKHSLEIDNGSVHGDSKKTAMMESCVLEEHESKRILQALFIEVEGELSESENKRSKTKVSSSCNRIMKSASHPSSPIDLNCSEDPDNLILSYTKHSKRSECSFTNVDMNCTKSETVNSCISKKLEEGISNKHLKKSCESHSVVVKDGCCNGKSLKFQKDPKESLSHETIQFDNSRLQNRNTEANKKRPVVTNSTCNTEVLIPDHSKLNINAADQMATKDRLGHKNVYYSNCSKNMQELARPSSPVLTVQTNIPFALSYLDEQRNSKVESIATKLISSSYLSINDQSDASEMRCFPKISVRDRKNIDNSSQELVLSSLIYKRRRAAIASEKKIHFSELSKKKKHSSSLIAISEGPTVIERPTTDRELDIEQCQNSVVKFDSVLKKSKANENTTTVLSDKLPSRISSDSTALINGDRNHLSEVNNSKPSNCNLCESTVKKKTNVQAANRKDTRMCENKKTFSGVNQCSICGKFFTRKANLRCHMQRHGFVDKRKNKKSIGEVPDHKLSCNVCQKSFNSVTHLRRHLSTWHKKVAAGCDICKGMFDSVKNLLLHKKRCHTSKDVINECEICGKTFVRYSTLTKHKKNHEKKKLWQCEISDQKFQGSALMQAHVVKEKAFQCHVCSRKCKTKESLATHSLTCNREIKHNNGKNILKRCSQGNSRKRKVNHKDGTSNSKR